MTTAVCGAKSERRGAGTATRVSNVAAGVPSRPLIPHPMVLLLASSLAGFRRPSSRRSPLRPLPPRVACRLAGWGLPRPLQPAKAGSPAEPLTLPANDAAVHGLSRFRIGAPVPDFDAVRQHRAAQRAGLRRRTSGAWGLTATVPRILRETSRTKLLCPEGSAPPFSPRNLRPRHMIAPAKPRRRDTAGTQAAVNSSKLLNCWCPRNFRRPDRGSQVRSRLAAGGSGIRILGPPAVKLRLTRCVRRGVSSIR
jgi:hypothetical protein